MPTFDEMEELRRRGLIQESTFDSFPQPEPASIPGDTGVELGASDLPTQEAVPIMEDQSLLPPEEVFSPVETPAVEAPVDIPIMEDQSLLPPEEVATKTPDQPVLSSVLTGQSETTTTQSKKPTKGAVQAQKDLQEGIDREQEANVLASEAVVSQARAASNLKQEEQRIQTEFGIAEQELRQQGQQEMDSKLAEIDTKIAELSDRKYEGYWAKQGTGNKIMAAISVALGAYGASLSGGSNAALSIMNRAMDDDFKQFESQTALKLKVIGQSRLSAAQKQKAINNELVTLQAKKISDIKVTQLKIEDLSNKFAQPEQKAKLAKLQAELEQESAKLRLEFESELMETMKTTVTKESSMLMVDKEGKVIRSKNQTDSGKPMTEGQSKTQGFMDGASDAENILTNTAPPSDSKLEFQQQFITASTVPYIGGAFEFVQNLYGTSKASGDWLDRLTEEDQKYLQASQQWIQNVLRKESGAAIGADEYKSTYATYFPMPGDLPGAVNQKNAARRKKIESMRVGTGNSRQRFSWEEQNK